MESIRAENNIGSDNDKDDNNEHHHEEEKLTSKGIPGGLPIYGRQSKQQIRRKG